jgi:hypothetical protein
LNIESVGDNIRDDGFGDLVGIPTILISKEDGLLIKNALKNGI